MNPDPYPAFLLGFSTCRPASRGLLEIRSPDPFAPPKIHPNYLDSAEDMVEMLEGVRFLRRLAATPALAGAIEEELKPGAQSRATRSWSPTSGRGRARCSTGREPAPWGRTPAGAVVDAGCGCTGWTGCG